MIIKGASGQEMSIGTGREDGYQWIIAMGADLYKTADLLAALNADPKSVAEALREELKTAREALHLALQQRDAEELRVAAAERDALAKTVERVREVVTRFLDPHGQDAVVAARVAEKIRAALDPEPAFVLPTTVPARIEARNKDGETVELHLWTDGHNLAWHNQSTEADLFPTAVMAYFTGHRLLDGEA